MPLSRLDIAQKHTGNISCMRSTAFHNFFESHIPTPQYIRHDKMYRPNQDYKAWNYELSSNFQLSNHLEIHMHESLPYISCRVFQKRSEIRKDL